VSGKSHLDKSQLHRCLFIISTRVSIERSEHEGDGQRTGEDVDGEDVLAVLVPDDRGFVLDGAHGDAEVVDGQQEAEHHEGGREYAEEYTAEATVGVERCTEVEGGHGHQVEEAQATALTAGGFVDANQGSVSGDHRPGEQEVGSQVCQGTEAKDGDADVRHDVGQCVGENVRQELFAGGHVTSRFLWRVSLRMQLYYRNTRDGITRSKVLKRIIPSRVCLLIKVRPWG